MPTIKATTIPTKVSSVNAKFPISKMVAPAIIGTDNRNVNLVAADLDSPINLAVKIVVPLLEKPGMMARAWDKPIINACFRVMC